MQKEITRSGKLLNNQGLLAQRGYAKKPLLEYNPENIALFRSPFLNRIRLKEWDYYAVTARDFFFSATVAHIGYAGNVFVYFIDFKKKTCIEKAVITPFGKGCVLPRTSEEGDIGFSNNNVNISFTRGRDRREIRVSWKNFDNGDDIAADLVALQPAKMDSIVMATPIGKKHFYYNQKINCMPTQGVIRYGKRTLALSGKNALTTLDWGRGCWEYRSFWNWASASGHLPGGHTIGLNLGLGFGDLTSASENCFFVDGKMTKLDRVEFLYDPADYMRPWYFASNDGLLNLTFTPFLERKARTNLLLIASEVHQMFGHYSGYVVAGGKRKIAVNNLVGWAEEHHARW
jgi:hypothetical protein